MEYVYVCVFVYSQLRINRHVGLLNEIVILTMLKAV